MADGLEDLDRLLHDLVHAAGEAVPVSAASIHASAAALTELWRANATRTARRAGKHYPASISFDVHAGAGGIDAEIGPVSSMPQGGMGRGFEYGSRNQPPHMDGNRAADVEEPRLEARLAAAVDKLL